MSVFNVYLSEDGRVTRTDQEGAIFSRSNLVNTLRVYSPYPSDYLIRAGFTRTDGVKVHSVFLFYVGQHEGYSLYEYNLTGDQVGSHGALAVALNIYKANQDALLTTATFTIQVGTSFEPLVEHEPVDDDNYTQLIDEALTRFQAAIDIGNKEIDAKPTVGSKNLVESGGVFNSIRDAKNEVNSRVDVLSSSKQDLLIAGDGIKIEGNVISAIGGGSGGGGGSGATTVTYRDSEYGIYFKATFPHEMTSVRDICEFLYEQGHEYGGNTYELDECQYYGETVSEDCGIYGQWDGDYPLLYLYLYGTDYPLHEEGFNFGGGSDYGDVIGYLLRSSEFDLAFNAPEGFSTLNDLWGWMREAGYTYDTGLPLNYIYLSGEEYSDGIVMTAGESSDFEVRYETGEGITSFYTDLSYDYFGNGDSAP